MRRAGRGGGRRRCRRRTTRWVWHCLPASVSTTRRRHLRRRCLLPDFADAWVNLGVARYRGGNIFAAKEAMRRALAAAPGHRAATANLAAFMRLTGEAEAAETLLRDLLARDADATAA